MEVFEKGKNEVEALGDNDILLRSAEFIGLYYHIQELFKDAMPYFEQAQGSAEHVVNPSAPIWLGYCAAYSGQFHRAIGTLDYYYRFTLERKDSSLAATIRAALGIVLLQIRKKEEASFHLSGAFQEAVKTDNALALYFTRGGLAYYHLIEGRLKEARNVLIQCIKEGSEVGLVRQYASPMILEMIYKFYQEDIFLITGLNFHREVLKIMQEPNVHLRGVALRLCALEKINNGKSLDSIRNDLEESEACLIRSGTPIQLAQTLLEMARLYIKEGNQEKARFYARKAQKFLSGYARDFYPDDLRHLISVKSNTKSKSSSDEEFFIRFMDIIRELMPGTDLDTLLHRAVRSTNRYFGAERGGLFWFGREKNSEPVLRASCNMTRGYANSESFHSNWK